VIVEVGNVVFPESDGIPINLTQEGPLVSGYEDNRLAFPAALCYLYEPMKIVYNLISELTQAAEANKQKIKGFDVALRLVETMSDDVDNMEVS
jgi:hypothetical protein